MPTNLVVMQDDVLSFGSMLWISQDSRRQRKRLLHGTLRLKNFPTDKPIQNGLPTDKITRDAITTFCGPTQFSLRFFPCRNFHDEYFVIFFHEIWRMYTCIYLRFVGFYGLLYKARDILLVFRKQRSVFHAVNRDDR